jgi:N-acetylglucosamine kinase-like BadF-type ATPase
MKYFLGVDVGSSKTHALIANESGEVTGTGLAGPGNHQTVGYDGMYSALNDSINQALVTAGISGASLTGSGFGISGFDWPSDKPDMLETISRLNISGRVDIQNDAVLGIVAGTQEGWGLAIVSGTGCNCWGWDRDRRKIGRVTGMGIMAGEAAGSTELIFRAMQLVSRAWTQRGSQTNLSQLLMEYVGATGIDDLVEGYTTYRYQVDGKAAPLIFQAAEAGDDVAMGLVRWAGSELGELAKAVIRQLHLPDEDFDVVLVGSMFEAGQILVEPIQETIFNLAPGARLVRLEMPPVVGAVLLGMEAGGLEINPDIREKLKQSLA